MPKNFSLLPFSLCVLVCSCGWHLSHEYAPDSKKSVSIPYVAGDSSGQMTAALVSAIVQQNTCCYVQEGGEFILEVSIVDTKSENIGFRYDPEKLANGKRKTIPSETRRKILAKVTLLHGISHDVVLGPAYILGSVDFDHQYYNLNHNINAFSLGQLTDIDTTLDVVDIPLYRNLSQRIADYIANNIDALSDSNKTANK